MYLKVALVSFQRGVEEFVLKRQLSSNTKVKDWLFLGGN